MKVKSNQIYKVTLSNEEVDHLLRFLKQLNYNFVGGIVGDKYEDDVNYVLTMLYLTLSEEKESSERL